MIIKQKSTLLFQKVIALLLFYTTVSVVVEGSSIDLDFPTEKKESKPARSTYDLQEKIQPVPVPATVEHHPPDLHPQEQDNMEKIYVDDDETDKVTTQDKLAYQNGKSDSNSKMEPKLRQKTMANDDDGTTINSGSEQFRTPLSFDLLQFPAPSNSDTSARHRRPHHSHHRNKDGDENKKVTKKYKEGRDRHRSRSKHGQGGRRGHKYDDSNRRRHFKKHSYNKDSSLGDLGHDEPLSKSNSKLQVVYSSTQKSTLKEIEGDKQESSVGAASGDEKKNPADHQPKVLESESKIKTTVDHALEAHTSSDVTGMEDYNMKFRLSARHLPNRDVVGTSDPYVIVSYADSENKRKTLLGKTSVILNNENPAWGDVFGFKYDSTKNQKWHFAVYDKDMRGKDDLIGSVWVKPKYFIEHGEFLKLELASDNESIRDSEKHAPILIIQKD